MAKVNFVFVTRQHNNIDKGYSFSALTLFVWRQEGHSPACKKILSSHCRRVEGRGLTRGDL